jgi:hypothetical protein
MSDVEKGLRRLLPAIADYEREMIRYGFEAVQASLTQMNRLHAESSIGRFATKAFFRFLDLSPALQKRFLDLGDGSGHGCAVPQLRLGDQQRHVDVRNQEPTRHGHGAAKVHARRRRAAD